jgi:hypothetical protein
MIVEVVREVLDPAPGPDLPGSSVTARGATIRRAPARLARTATESGARQGLQRDLVDRVQAAHIATAVQRMLNEVGSVRSMNQARSR